MPLPHFKLVSHKLCPYVQRSVITLSEKNIPFERVDIDLADKPQWFKALSPTGKVPLLVVDGEHVLFESSVITEYLDEITPASLHDSDPLVKARHRAWIELGSSILNTIGGLYNAPDESVLNDKVAQLKQKFAALEQQLKGDEFFAGDEFQLIDATFGPIFRYFDVFEQFVDLHIFDDFPRVQAWREALKNRTSVQQAVGDDYGELLHQFVKNKQSHLADLFDARVG